MFNPKYLIHFSKIPYPFVHMMVREKIPYSILYQKNIIQFLTTSTLFNVLNDGLKNTYIQFFTKNTLCNLLSYFFFKKKN